MKKIIILAALIVLGSGPVNSWWSHTYLYTDMQWIDADTILVTRTDYGGGRGEATSEVLVVTVTDKQVRNLTPVYEGFLCSDNSSNIFLHTNREIVLYNFADNGRSRIKTVYTNRSRKPDVIQQLQNVIKNKISFFQRDQFHHKKYLYDYNKKKILDTEDIDDRYYLLNRFRKTDVPGSVLSGIRDERYLVQVAAFKSLKNVEVLIKKLHKRNYHLFYSPDNGLYKVYAGPFEKRTVDSHMKVLGKISANKTFAVKHVFSTYGELGLIVNDLNIWIKLKGTCKPLFRKRSAATFISVVNNRYCLFLKNNSVYSYDLKQHTLHSVSVSTNSDRMKGEYIKPWWNKKMKRVLFSRFNNNKKEHWLTDIQGSGLKKITPGTSVVKEYSKVTLKYNEQFFIDHVNNYMQQFKKNGNAEDPVITVPGPGNKVMLVKLIINTSGAYYTNSIWIKENEKEYELLQSISNW